MHRPSSQPHPCLYYPYKIHRPWLPTDHQAQAQVVIVGAGPAGLVTALELARHGVSSVVLASELQVSLGSRAIVFTRRSMEILQQVGVASRMSARGLPWRIGHSHYRGQRVFRMEAPHDPDDRFHPMLNLQQQFLEEYLVEACQAQPLIDLRWGNQLIGLNERADHAELTIDTPAGPYTLQSQWVVAADGGRSTLRSLLNLKMEGSSYEGQFVIADIRADLPLPTERLAFFDPEWNPGNTVLMHREPLGIWRIDYQLPTGQTAQEALRPESLRNRIQATLAMVGHAEVPWEMDWASVYSARTLTLPDFRSGRVLFTGDAAHLLPIFGVRGANTAFQDSQSLGWHLAFVIQGWASERLLSNYSRERVAAAREIIEESGKSTRFMTPPTRGFALLRNAVLSLSLQHEFVRPLFHWRTSRAHAYAHSMLNAPDDDNAAFIAGPGHGAPPQNVCLGPDQFLLDHLGGGFDLLYFTKGSALPAGVREVLDAFGQRGIRIRVHAIGPDETPEGADHSIADPQGRVAARYGVPGNEAAYLLRPDQHICARWLHLDPARLRTALQAALPH